MENQIGIYDFETGENIVRDMTPKELEQYQSGIELDEQLKQEAVLKEQTKKDILDKIGISEDDLKAILQ